MSTPTPEQASVLDDTARVRVVRAVPGSGKTWLVAELIKRELAKWTSRHSGIAALSFTRVGGEEIRRAVGYDLHHPHFVGTLDAFVFRFLVRPFLQQVRPEVALPRLIPADWAPERWRTGPKGVQWGVRPIAGPGVRSLSILQSCFIGEENGDLILAHPKQYQSGLQRLSAEDARRVLEAKKHAWQKSGCMTHSDVAKFATEILADKVHGTTIRAELARRFPLIIVDELQDTGWFLGRCVLQLLAEPSVRGFLVGDPDQAIYEFNGARPDLFDRFTTINGAKQLSLGSTLRCGPAVCKVAEHLAELNRSIAPAPNRTGHAFLLSYSKLEADIAKLRAWLGRRSENSVVKMVARHTNTVQKITGRAVKEAPKLRSVPLNHLHRAVICFRQARKVTALAAAQAALEYAVFGHEGVTREELTGKGFSLAAWKRTGVEVLLTANSEVRGENFDAWGHRMVVYIEQRIADIFPTNQDGSVMKKIKPPAGDAKGKMRQNYLPIPASQVAKESHVAVLTVHGVKGETHDLSVFVCPDVNQPDRCPSVVWWSADSQNQEERRIAFVAVTRTRGDLVVCVSDQCFARLQNTRAQFLKSFECMSIDDFLEKDEDFLRKTVAMN